jgi:hypothetical protein
MDSIQFYPNAVMQDGDELITYMHVNGITPSSHDTQQGSAAILLLLFLIFLVASRKKSSK